METEEKDGVLILHSPSGPATDRLMMIAVFCVFWYLALARVALGDGPDARSPWLLVFIVLPLFGVVPNLALLRRSKTPVLLDRAAGELRDGSFRTAFADIDSFEHRSIRSRNKFREERLLARLSDGTERLLAAAPDVPSAASAAQRVAAYAGKPLRKGTAAG